MPSIYNAAAVPPLTVIEGSTNTESWRRSTAPIRSGPVCYVNWLGGSATAYSPPEIYAVGTEFLPGIGNVPGICCHFDLHGRTIDRGESTAILCRDRRQRSRRGAPTFVFGTIQVLEAPLTLGAGVPPTSVPEGFTVLATSQLVHFTDAPRPPRPVTSRQRSTRGDGSPESAGVIGQFGPGSFFVQGGHTYTKPMTATIVITIQDVNYGGSKLVA